MQTVRGEFFRSLGAPLLSLQQQDLIFPVIECRLEYKSPARYNDALNVELWLSELARIRLTFSYRLAHQPGQRILEGSTRHVCTTLAEKLKRLPEKLIEFTLHSPARDWLKRLWR